MRTGIVLALAACTSALAAPRVRIELVPQAEVTSGEVRLGQVAHLNSPELGLVRQLVHLPIGRVPRAGTSAVLERGALARWLWRDAGLAEDEVQWEGAASTQVQRTVHWVRGERIADAALDALQAQLGAHGLRNEMRVRFVPRDVEAPGGEVRLQPRALNQQEVRSRMVVWVDLWVDADFLRTVPVTIDVDSGGSASLTDLAAASVSHPQGPAAGGRGLSPSLVARGEWATLRSGAGAVSLESRVEVLQDGRLGERVRARQSGATGIVFARVLGRSLLELVP